MVHCFVLRRSGNLARNNNIRSVVCAILSISSRVSFILSFHKV